MVWLFVPGWPLVDQIFVTSAALGGVLLLAWLAIQFFAGGLDGGEGVFGDASPGEADGAFALLTFQGLMSFFTMFGLVGLTLHREAGVMSWLALSGGTVGGLTAAWGMSRLFKLFTNLQSSGTMGLESAIGETGKVYLRIPADGVGKVELTVGNRLRVIDAICVNRVELPSDARVRVLRVSNGTTLVVERA